MVRSTAQKNWDKWWVKNKERVNARRRKKYREDKEYRQRAVDRSRHQTVVKRMQRLENRGAKLGKDIVIHNGEEEAAYQVAQVAELINRRRDLIFRWRKAGIVPKATHTDARGFALYSASQVRWMQELIALENITYEDLGAYLKWCWEMTYTDAAMEEVRMEWEDDSGEEA